MWVILYDEGMYPSGSSSGQVVAEDPPFRTRGLVCVDRDEAEPGREVRGVRIGSDDEPGLAPGQNLVAVVRRKRNGHRLAVIDRAARPGYSYIHGLHFVENDPPRHADRREVGENHPPAADILNPEAVVCFQRQRDFNYLEARHLWEDAKVGFAGIDIAEMHYNALITEGDFPKEAEPAVATLAKAKRVIQWEGGMADEELVERINRVIEPDVEVTPSAPHLRVRHLRKDETEYYLLFNEGAGSLEFQLKLAAPGTRILMDPTLPCHEVLPNGASVVLAPHALRVLAVARL